MAAHVGEVTTGTVWCEGGALVDSRLELGRDVNLRRSAAACYTPVAGDAVAVVLKQKRVTLNGVALPPLQYGDVLDLVAIRAHADDDAVTHLCNPATPDVEYAALAYDAIRDDDAFVTAVRAEVVVRVVEARVVAGRVDRHGDARDAHTGAAEDVEWTVRVRAGETLRDCLPATPAGMNVTFEKLPREFVKTGTGVTREEYDRLDLGDTPASHAPPPNASRRGGSGDDEGSGGARDDTACVATNRANLKFHTNIRCEDLVPDALYRIAAPPAVRVTLYAAIDPPVVLGSMEVAAGRTAAQNIAAFTAAHGAGLAALSPFVGGGAAAGSASGAPGGGDLFFVNGADDLFRGYSPYTRHGPRCGLSGEEWEVEVAARAKEQQQPPDVPRTPPTVLDLLYTDELARAAACVLVIPFARAPPGGAARPQPPSGSEEAAAFTPLYAYLSTAVPRATPPRLLPNPRDRAGAGGNGVCPRAPLTTASPSAAAGDAPAELYRELRVWDATHTRCCPCRCDPEDAGALRLERKQEVMAEALMALGLWGRGRGGWDLMREEGNVYALRRCVAAGGGGVVPTDTTTATTTIVDPMADGGDPPDTGPGGSIRRQPQTAPAAGVPEFALSRSQERGPGPANPKKPPLSPAHRSASSVPVFGAGGGAAPASLPPAHGTGVGAPARVAVSVDGVVQVVEIPYGADTARVVQAALGIDAWAEVRSLTVPRPEALRADNLPLQLAFARVPVAAVLVVSDADAAETYILLSGADAYATLQQQMALLHPAHTVFVHRRTGAPVGSAVALARCVCAGRVELAAMTRDTAAGLGEALASAPAAAAATGPASPSRRVVFVGVDDDATDPSVASPSGKGPVQRDPMPSPRAKARTGAAAPPPPEMRAASGSAPPPPAAERPRPHQQSQAAPPPRVVAGGRGAAAPSPASSVQSTQSGRGRGGMLPRAGPATAARVIR